jgi:hypothetical protein
MSSLTAACAVLRPGGFLVFEVRDPARRAWEHWHRSATYRTIHIPEVGMVDTWVELTDIRRPFVSFQQTFVFEADGAVVTSTVDGVE